MLLLTKHTNETETLLKCHSYFTLRLSSYYFQAYKCNHGYIKEFYSSEISFALCKVWSVIIGGPEDFNVVYTAVDVWVGNNSLQTQPNISEFFR